MRTKIVCSFCGRKLPARRDVVRALLARAVSREVAGLELAAVRRRRVRDARDLLLRRALQPQRHPAVPVRRTARCSSRCATPPARQRAIQDARRAEGWTYAGDVLQGWSDKQGNQIRYVQGPEYLEKITSTIGGEILDVRRARRGRGRVAARPRRPRHRRAALHEPLHVRRARAASRSSASTTRTPPPAITSSSMTADYAYANDALASVDDQRRLRGLRGRGRAEDRLARRPSRTRTTTRRRVAKEELTVTSFNKTYDAEAARRAARRSRTASTPACA